MTRVVHDSRISAFRRYQVRRDGGFYATTRGTDGDFPLFQANQAFKSHFY